LVHNLILCDIIIAEDLQVAVEVVKIVEIAKAVKRLQRSGWSNVCYTKICQILAEITNQTGGYMMRFTSFILVCFSTAILASLLGCAVFGGGQVSGINWALEKNGGRVSAFSEEPDHPASKLIDGTTSSEGWDQGEGWQASITAAGRARGRQARRDEQERNWVIVELAQPVLVNQVKVYTIDSEKYPARNFGVSDLLIQYELETASKDMIWVNTERFGKKIGDQDNTVRDNVRGVIDVKFKPVNTQRIRLLIYSTNDLAQTESGESREGTIRLTEVEVYGTGTPEGRDELEMLFEG
jgi:hypothetical protein